MPIKNPLPSYAEILIKMIRINETQKSWGMDSCSVSALKIYCTTKNMLRKGSCWPPDWELHSQLRGKLSSQSIIEGCSLGPLCPPTASLMIEKSLSSALPEKRTGCHCSSGSCWKAVNAKDNTQTCRGKRGENCSLHPCHLWNIQVTSYTVLGNPFLNTPGTAAAGSQQGSPDSLPLGSPSERQHSPSLSPPWREGQQKTGIPGALRSPR